MSLSVEETKEIIKKFATGPADTGSPAVQTALLTARVNKLTEHFKTNVKDHHGRRGLMKLVGQRRRLLKYLERKSTAEYKKLIEQLGLRK